MRAEKAKEERARLAAELATFFEDAAAGDDDDDSGMEAVEIPDLKEEAEAEAEADALFDGENDSDDTGSESSSEEDSGLFDFDQLVADCLLL